MELVACILWLLLGGFYTVFKLGGGGASGVGCVIVVIVAVAIIALSPWLALFIVVALIVVAVVYTRRDTQADEERIKIADIRKTLPMPTRGQMKRFIDDIYSEEYPSSQQKKYLKMLNDTESNLPTEPLDAECFKDMQAAWIYYVDNEIETHECRRIFGYQDLADKTYFDPDIPRKGRRVRASRQVFKNMIKSLSMSINDGWVMYPQFIRRVFDMIENKVQLSEELLYPVMLESRKWNLNPYPSWMGEDIRNMWCDVLTYRVNYALSQIPMSRAQEDEWLSVDDFILAILPMVIEKRFIESDELFPILHSVYNKLVDEEFDRRPLFIDLSSVKSTALNNIMHYTQRTHDFVVLWNGLNTVGNAIGKTASFHDYPKYIIR